MLVDALLAWVHYVLIFALSECLFAEIVFYRRELDRATLVRLQRVDLAYGILAGSIVASGLARVFFSPKGAAYYAHNPVFWTKMGLFVALGLLSIAPTLHFVRLAKGAASDGTVRVAARAFAATRGYLAAEIALLLLLPLCAAFMARGFAAV